MPPSMQSELLYREAQHTIGSTGTWTGRVSILWSRRALLLRVFAVSIVVATGVAFLVPKEYKSVARIMPPDQQNTSAAVLAALSARAGNFGALGSLASGLLGVRSTTFLFISLLQSGTVSGELVDHFHLQSVYHQRYAVDAAKKLAHHTKITDDKKSGVITIEVTDHDPVRARDIAQAYLDNLNRLVIQTSTSSAHQERMFIEQRLSSVSADLERAQKELSEFSSRNNTVDLKEQTRAMVDAGARVEGALVMEQSTLNSLRQVYGDQNLRVRQAQTRVDTLRRELGKVAGNGTSAGQDSASSTDPVASDTETYPPLRQLPLLAVPYADLYRRVRVEETVYELLTQQYETARIEEAKDVPVVSVIDRPAVPEKKSFPPRALLVILATAATVAAAAGFILLSHRWAELPDNDEMRSLLQKMRQDLWPRSESAGL